MLSYNSRYYFETHINVELIIIMIWYHIEGHEMLIIVPNA